MLPIPYGATFQMFAHCGGKFGHEHFGSPLFVRMSQECAVVVPVVLTITEDGPLWGWWDVKHNTVSMIYWRRMLAEMCFTYGSRAEEDRDRGRLVRLTLTPG